MLKEHETIIDLIREINAEYFCEVGVWRGDLAVEVIPEVKQYIGIDQYKDYPIEAGGRVVKIFRQQENTKKCWNDLYFKTKERLGAFPNAVLLREKSEQAVEKFPREYFDMVYIDADHRDMHVLKDIRLWLPKVRPGGILCGHDYGAKAYKGVKQVVDLVFPKAEIRPTRIWIHRKGK